MESDDQSDSEAAKDDVRPTNKHNAQQTQSQTDFVAATGAVDQAPIQHSNIALMGDADLTP